MQRNLLIPGRKKKNKSAEELLSGKRSKLCRNKSFFFFSFFHHTAFCPRLKPSRPGKIRSCILLYSTIYHHGLRKMSGALSVDRWGFYLCTPLSDNIRALADLWRAQQGFFICMQNSPLEGKRCVLFFQGAVCKQGGRTKKKTVGLKRRKRDVTKKPRRVFAVYSRLFIKRRCIWWEPLLVASRTGGCRKHKYCLPTYVL